MFARPKLKEILKKGYMPVDMHTHSKYSDGLNKIDTILKNASKKHFGIALTDHNEIRGSIEAYKSKKAFVIPAIEINSFDGPHLLCYFYNIGELKEFYEKHIKNNKRKDPNSRINLRTAEIISRLERYNCLVSVAHPFGPFWTNLLKYLKKNNEGINTLKKVHALEVVCGEQLRRSNLRAIKFNLIIDKCFTGGSDAHIISEYGKVVTCSDSLNVEDFLDSIKKKENFVVGKGVGVVNRVISHSNVIKKHARTFNSWIRDSYNRVNLVPRPRS